jgi:hypothetical protein
LWAIRIRRNISRRSPTGSTARPSIAPTDISQPFGNASRNNLLNRTNLRPPNGKRSSGAFGTITSTYDPRQLQLGFKLNF